MLQLQIIKDGKKLDTICAETEAELLSWLQVRKDHKTFGAEGYSYEQLVSEEIPATFDEEGVELTPAIPAVYETIHVPGEYIAEIKDITVEVSIEKTRQDKIEAGRKARQVCTEVLDLVAGENLSVELTMEQITDMQTIFGPIQSALMSSRPSLAKILISSVEPGELVSAELKASVLELLADY